MNVNAKLKLAIIRFALQTADCSPGRLCSQNHIDGVHSNSHDINDCLSSLCVCQTVDAQRLQGGSAAPRTEVHQQFIKYTDIPDLKCLIHFVSGTTFNSVWFLVRRTSKIIMKQPINNENWKNKINKTSVFVHKNIYIYKLSKQSVNNLKITTFVKKNMYASTYHLYMCVTDLQ